LCLGRFDIENLRVGVQVSYSLPPIEVFVRHTPSVAYALEKSYGYAP
jgi:hypothetical protein